MKIRLKKSSLKSLSATHTLNIQQTPQVQGGGVRPSFYTFCNTFEYNCHGQETYRDCLSAKPCFTDHIQACY